MNGTAIIIQAIIWLIMIIQYVILARVIISWLPIPKDNQFISLIYHITEPILAPIRSIIEKSSISRNSMFDFSPLVAFLLIGIIVQLLGRLA